MEKTNRTLLELYILLLKQIMENNALYTGLCGLVVNLLNDNIISKEENYRLHTDLDARLFKILGSKNAYLAEPGELQPRVDFLLSVINELTITPQ
jgi:hypothetical protein